MTCSLVPNVVKVIYVTQAVVDRKVIHFLHDMEFHIFTGVTEDENVPCML